MTLLLLLAACTPEPEALRIAHPVRRDGAVGVTVGRNSRSDAGPDLHGPCEPGATVVVETRGADGEWTAAPTVVVECDAAPRVDTVVVADNSGSETGFLAPMVDALKGFVDELFSATDGNRMGIARVSTVSSEELPLTGSVAAVYEAIDDLFISNGWTALWDGVRIGNGTLDAGVFSVSEELDGMSCYAGSYPSMVVFTDGQENNSADEHETTLTGDGIDTTFEDLLAMTAGGVPTAIHVVGIGHDVDVDQLTTLATTTGGTYVGIDGWDELPDALVASAEIVSSEVPICFQPADCADTDVRVTITFADGSTQVLDDTLDADPTCDDGDDDTAGGDDTGTDDSGAACDPSANPFTTRTQGFWKTHTCVLEGLATGFPLLPVTLGSGTTFTTAAEVEAYLSTSPKGDAAISMGHQLVATKLNAVAFGLGAMPYADVDGDGDAETVSEIIARADALYDSGSKADRTAMNTVLDDLNNSGDPLDTWFDVHCTAAPELCDGDDDDGDGSVDESCYCGG